MTTFMNDLDVIDPTATELSGPLYPIAQWLHGDPKMAAAGGVAHTGGIILPAKYLNDDVPPAPGWTRTTVAFSSGKSEMVLAAQKPRLAVIRTRFRWFRTVNGTTTYYPRNDYQADTGMRGHLQVLCGIHGFDFPVVVTFKGKASQEFERLLKEFADKVLGAADKLRTDKTKPRWPRCAFWMRLVPGPHVKVGQKGQESIITPPTLEVPAVIGEEYLGKVYVGRDLLKSFQDDYHTADEWVARWDKGEEPVIEPDYDDEAPAGPNLTERATAALNNSKPTQTGRAMQATGNHFNQQPPVPEVPDDPNW